MREANTTGGVLTSCKSASDLIIAHRKVEAMATRPFDVRPALNREEMVVLGTSAAFGAGLALWQAAGLF